MSVCLYGISHAIIKFRCSLLLGYSVILCILLISLFMQTYERLSLSDMNDFSLCHLPTFYQPPSVGGGDKSMVTELVFAHVTTKFWPYLGMFGFFRRKIFLLKKMAPPPAKSHFENTMVNKFLTFLILTEKLQKINLDQ